MADCTAIQTRLDAAREAYDELLTGRAIRRFVDQNGESVEYTMANRQGLQSYIAKLENDLAICQGTKSAYRGPIRFTFGRRPY